ncbi:MAG: hypothetical protein Q9220_003349 [cf. Caloplaca sp. 1 TL-2023]
MKTSYVNLYFWLFVAHSTSASPVKPLGSLSSPLLELGRRALRARDLEPGLPKGIPGCNTKATDPSWAPDKSRWTDGEGYYVGNDCDNGAGFPGHCWTDYFLVGTTAAYQNWQNPTGPIACPPTGSCSTQQGQLTQKCESNSIAVGVELEADFKNAIARIFELEVTISAEYTHVWQSCNTKSITDICLWSDGKCHSVWTSEQLLTLYGYKRRSCDTPSGASGINIPNSAKRPDGFYTRGMQDFKIDLPKQQYVNCNGSCEPTYYPGPLPYADDTLLPIAPV